MGDERVDGIRTFDRVAGAEDGHLGLIDDERHDTGLMDGHQLHPTGTEQLLGRAPRLEEAGGCVLEFKFRRGCRVLP